MLTPKNVSAAVVFSCTLLAVSGCEQFSSYSWLSFAKQQEPTRESEIVSRHTALPRSVAAIELSLARIACVESFGGNRPDLYMLGDMQTLPKSSLRWDVIPAGQRELLRNVAKRLATAHEHYSAKFNAARRPMAATDRQPGASLND